jgi:hypothetical protein
MLVGLYNIGDSAQRVASRSSGKKSPVLLLEEAFLHPVKQIIELKKTAIIKKKYFENFMDWKFMISRDRPANRLVKVLSMLI